MDRGLERKDNGLGYLVGYLRVVILNDVYMRVRPVVVRAGSMADTGT